MSIAKRRARRIAADEAHAWARNLRLKNPYAKLLLCMMTGYVDGDGVCFVSVTALSEDCELSTNSIRDRLTWLEDIGVIARSPQWIDEYGHRNGDGRGRRTSDNIRLMIDLNEDGIEARAVAKEAAKSRRSDPARREGSNSEADPSSDEGSTNRPENVALSPTLQRPSDSVEGLISEPEPEPESLPKPLSEGLSDDSENDGLKEPEHFAEFWNGYPGHEVMSRYRALELFVLMSVPDREHARAAVSELTRILKKLDRKARDAHKWLAEKGWLEFPRAKIVATPAASQRRIIKFDELAAVTVALTMANQRPLSTISVASEETGKSTDASFWPRAIGADLLALADLVRADQSNWDFVEEGSQRFAAWRKRLEQWVGVVDTARKWLEDYNPAVHGLAGSDPNFRIRKSVRGLRVPREFPPRVDGSWANDGDGEAA